MSALLVVVDVQNDFVTGSLGTPEAVAAAERSVRRIAGFDGDVVYTMDTHGPDYLRTHEGRILPVEHCIEGTWGWENPPEVRDALESRGAMMYKKSTFASLDLAGDPRLPDAESVVVIGLCTDVCVVSNALLLRAAAPDADVTVDASCCAGSTPGMHRAALGVMRSCQIGIVG